MERLKNMKESLVNCAQSQMANLGRVDTHEMGEVIDMIKDLDEAMYYCSIVKAMEEKEQGSPEAYHHYYYPVPVSSYDREMDYQSGRMYYGGNGGGSSSGGSSGGSLGGSSGYSSSGRSSGGNNARGGGTRGFEMYPYPSEIRDYREGRSSMSRRGYMESKEMGQDKSTQMRELETYLNELAQDITEMIQGAGPEEKTMLQQKLNNLASKMK